MCVGVRSGGISSPFLCAIIRRERRPLGCVASYLARATRAIRAVPMCERLPLIENNLCCAHRRVFDASGVASRCRKDTVRHPTDFVFITSSRILRSVWFVIGGLHRRQVRTLMSAFGELVGGNEKSSLMNSFKVPCWPIACVTVCPYVAFRVFGEKASSSTRA